MAPNRLHGNVEVHVDSSGQIFVKAHRDLAKELGKALREIADLAREIVKREHHRTGRMGRSIQPYRGRSAKIVQTGPTTISGTVTAGSRLAPYTRFVHEGSFPHKIRARKPGGKLSFVGAGQQGRKTFTRTRLRRLNDEEWTNLEFNGTPEEYNAAVRRHNRRVADWKAGRNSWMRHRDADTTVDETTHTYKARRVVIDEVDHPGYRGHRFLNQAAAIVIARRYGGGVNLPARGARTFAKPDTFGRTGFAEQRW